MRGFSTTLCSVLSWIVLTRLDTELLSEQSKYGQRHWKSFADYLRANVLTYLSKVYSRISSGSEKEAGTILICVLYMICSRDQIDNKMSIVARKIASKVVDHPMLIEVFAKQREAERMEEASGNPVPSDYCLTNGKALLEDPAAPYGGIISMLDEDLLTCIADKDRFDEFVKIINGEILSFIKSPEGGGQFWEVVKDISIEKGYISRRCRRNRFARIISAICPNAGEARKIDQNMRKYSEIDPKKSNDYAAIRSRFVFNITK